MQGEVTAAAGRAAVTGTPVRRRRLPTAPYALLAPTVLYLLIFFAWPMLQSLVLAFQDAEGAWSLSAVQRMTSDLHFSDALKTTLLFAGVVIPLQTVLAVG